MIVSLHCTSVGCVIPPSYSAVESGGDNLCVDFRPSKQHYGIRNSPNQRFVWNSHLLKQVETILCPDWILHITHGFVSQSNVSIFGWSVYITLIARRSNRFAGTRFLKRGSNFEVSRFITCFGCLLLDFV